MPAAKILFALPSLLLFCCCCSVYVQNRLLFSFHLWLGSNKSAEQRPTAAEKAFILYVSEQASIDCERQLIHRRLISKDVVVVVVIVVDVVFVTVVALLFLLLLLLLLWLFSNFQMALLVFLCFILMFIVHPD